MPMLDNSDHQSLFLDNNNISNGLNSNNNSNWDMSVSEDDHNLIQNMSPLKLHNSYPQRQPQLHHNLTPIKFNDNNNDYDHSWLSTPITTQQLQHPLSTSNNGSSSSSTLNSSFSPSNDLLFSINTQPNNNNNESFNNYNDDIDFTNYQHQYQTPIQERYITTTTTTITSMTPKLPTTKPKINMSNMICKSCSNSNGKSIVKLKPNHISFMEVMFVCPEKDCVFPILDKDIDKFIFPAAYFKSVKKE